MDLWLEKKYILCCRPDFFMGILRCPTELNVRCAMLVEYSPTVLVVKHSSSALADGAVKVKYNLFGNLLLAGLYTGGRIK